MVNRFFNSTIDYRIEQLLLFCVGSDGSLGRVLATKAVINSAMVGDFAHIRSEDVKEYIGIEYLMT